MSTSTQASTVRSRVQIDPRGPRFAATVTALVLAGALLTAPSGATAVLLAGQVLVFAIGAMTGVQHTPYAWLFRVLVRPRLGAPAELEDAAPPRFAQGVGLAFGVVALAGYVAGADLLGAVATAFALAAAFLNAAFGYCLGCELYLLVIGWASPGAHPMTRTDITSTTTVRTAGQRKEHT